MLRVQVTSSPACGLESDLDPWAHGLGECVSLAGLESADSGLTDLIVSRTTAAADVSFDQL